MAWYIAIQLGMIEYDMGGLGIKSIDKFKKEVLVDKNILID